MIAKILNWWVEGLAAALLASRRAFHRPRRFYLDSQAQSLILRPVNASAGASIPVTTSGSEMPAAILKETRGSTIEIVVPKAAILKSHLDPLPSESRPYVENVVKHQLERLFPWRADEILHATEIKSRDDGSLDVTVRATPRFAISQMLTVAKECGAADVFIVSAVGTDEAAIPVVDERLSPAKIARAQSIARYAVVGLLLFALAAIGWTTFTRWSLENEIAELEQTISDRRVVLKRASEPRGGGDGIDARKQSSVIATIVLEALTGVLPDDTYLTDMSLEAARVRITGVSPRATELVPMLEGSGHFKNASFYAPTTRMPGRNTDRFSIEASVVPKLQVTP